MKNAEQPAYPNDLKQNKAMNGLTKREYFASMVIQGLCAAETEDYHFSSYEKMAEQSVKIADALLKQLGDTK